MIIIININIMRIVFVAIEFFPLKNCLVKNMPKKIFILYFKYVILLFTGINK